MKKLIGFTWIFIFSLAVFAQAQAPKSNWATFEKNKIHYYDIGNQKSKNALLFIHGWSGNTDVWKQSYSSFPDYRVIVVDLIGHGQSDKPKVTYTMDYFAKSVEAVMTKAKVEKAVLVGHSMGTPVARQFYRLFPGKTLGIVIVDGGLRAFGTKEEVDQFYAPLRADYKKTSMQFMDGMLQTIKDESIKQQLRAGVLATPEHVGLSSMESFNDDKLWATDPIKVPVLAVLAESPFWKPDTEQFFRSLASNLDYDMWKGVGHFLMMEKPKEFNERVRAFISKNKLLDNASPFSRLEIL